MIHLKIINNENRTVQDQRQYIGSFYYQRLGSFLTSYLNRTSLTQNYNYSSNRNKKIKSLFVSSLFLLQCHENVFESLTQCLEYNMQHSLCIEDTYDNAFKNE